MGIEEDFKNKNFINFLDSVDTGKYDLSGVRLIESGVRALPNHDQSIEFTSSRYKIIQNSKSDS